MVRFTGIQDFPSSPASFPSPSPSSSISTTISAQIFHTRAPVDFRPAWQKRLYIRQPYPDNYVDRSFLSGLRRNMAVRLYSYTWLVLQSGAVMQHASSILIFVSLFIFLHRGWMSASVLILLANNLTFLGYLSWMAYVWRCGSDFRPIGKQVAKSAVLFMMSLLGLTPILKTLTEDTSNDTIWALSTICFLVNFASYDYAAAASLRMTSTADGVALNAAIFASVLLASRLPTKAHVFGLMSLAVDWFALFPLLRRIIKVQFAAYWDVILTVVLAVGGLLMLLVISPAAALAFAVAHLLCTLLCPALYVHLQRYKSEIQGPWDEAAVMIKRRQKGGGPFILHPTREK